MLHVQHVLTCVCVFDCTTFAEKYFNLHVIRVPFRECVGCISCLAADTFTRTAKERGPVCKAHAKDKRIYKWQVTWVKPPRADTRSKHVLSLTCPRTCSLYPVLALASHNCVNVSRLSACCLRSSAQLVVTITHINILQGAVECRTVHSEWHRKGHPCAGASMSLKGTRCYFLHLTLFFFIEMWAAVFTTGMEDIKVQLQP